MVSKQRFGEFGCHGAGFKNSFVKHYSANPKIPESLPPLLMERVGVRRIKQAFSFFDSPHPTPSTLLRAGLSGWRGIVVLRTE